MGAMFEAAVENELIEKNPVTKNVKCKSGKPPKETRVLTIEEQKLFLKRLKNPAFTTSGHSFFKQGYELER